MIRVVFVKRPEVSGYREGRKDFWLRERGDEWQFQHCYVLVGNVMIIHCHDIQFHAIPDNEMAELLANVDGRRVIIELPISGKWIIKKRLSVKPRYWVNNRGYSRAWEHHFNPLAFTGTAYTCSNMVGKLLGYVDFYSLEPDDLYNRLEQYRGDTSGKSHGDIFEESLI